ncbi:DnaK suppressor protein [Moraxella caprae]|uniref:DnaK suppressor protein n=1 Tax=Moraxella caprae TaxID=90240 RepID=A0A378R049_9GAMM|nr:TraR/DksA C4-type zinc finger protein [Moraxella caprae]STZ08584.1 DnaK suppressor protein [Moraxella caprae]
MDTIDKANADYERWLNGKIKQRQTTPANDITECLDCGEPIGEKRKQAVPYAVRCVACVACQSEFERGK